MRSQTESFWLPGLVALRWGWLGLLLASQPLRAQSPFQGLEALFTPPNSYVVQHTTEALAMDGNLRESAWQQAPWTTDFVDIEGAARPRPGLRTRAKLLWNDSTLFIAATLREPALWATQTHHDDIIFKDNDFEVFLDPDNDTHRYFELEFNQLGQTFDLFLAKPYRNGGDALVSWDAPGLRSGIQLAGTLGQPQDQDEGWTVEMAIPLRSLRIGYPLRPPVEGALWRINFSRVEWDVAVAGGQYRKRTDAAGKDLPEHNWVWSPQGVIDMHYPERWGYLQFTRRPGTTFRLPYAEVQRRYLWLVYYRQQAYRARHGRYATTLAELAVPPQLVLDNQPNHLQLEATPSQFSATVAVAGGAPIRITNEGLIDTLAP